MAKRRKKAAKKSSKKSSKKSTACKVISVKGQGRRKICRDKKGRITSNKKA